MKMVSRIGVTLLLGLAGAAVSAAPVLWVADATAKLNTVDAATGAVTIIGSTGSTYLTDIAFSPSGALYGVSGEGNLYQVNKVTAAVTLLGNTGLLPTSLVFGADGTLYTATTELYKLNTATGAPTLVGSGGDAYESTGDLAFVSGQLYLSSKHLDLGAGFNYEDLVRLDTTTGAGTFVGHLGSYQIGTGTITGFLAVWGMASPDNSSLYGVVGRQVIGIDPLTAATSLLVYDYGLVPPGNTLGGANGAAFASEAVVPAPPALWLLGTAMAGLVGRRLRRGFWFLAWENLVISHA